jgi:hypothetical protein
MINLRRDAKWDNNTTLSVKYIDIDGEEQVIGSAAFADLPVTDAICSKGFLYRRDGYPTAPNVD